MGKINTCLKVVFISFNILFAILGALLIYGLVRTGLSAEMQAIKGPSTLLVLVFAIGILGISLLGSIAAKTENKTCLKVFAGLMGIGMIIMLFFGITTASSKTQVKEVLKSPEVAKMFTDDLAMLRELEQNMQCCGWTGVKEYSQIPYSCSCTPSKTKCKSNPQGFTGPSYIYPQSCLEVFIYYAEIGINILLGFYFGFCLVAMFGLIIALNMIRQINRYDHFGDTTIAMRAF